MNTKKPLILISNDDGYHAKGINSLIDMLRDIADIIVCAPESARSGFATAFSATVPLRLKLRRDEVGMQMWSCNGTPVDCVKIALQELFADRLPDMILGGINHGDNASVNVHYSGTMGVTLEGCMKYIPSIGFSLCDFSSDADFEPLRPYVRQIVQKVLSEGLPKGVCLNVNFPKLTEFKGIKVCRMAMGTWYNECVKQRHLLGYNAFLKVTTAKYYIPSGRCIQALDYAHRNDDGSVGTVPDSLIREFRTSGGRKVYDGGGVMPDVRIEPQYVSRFTTVLYGKGYLEDFANDYFRRHREGVDVDRFTLPDDEYDRFVEFMQDKDVEVESQTQRTVDELRRQAEREKYLDRISGELEAIERKLKDDKNADLQAFREDIRKLLESEIVMRYHYYAGVARHSALRDRKVRAAVELLADTARYRRILSQQDTERK